MGKNEREREREREKEFLLVPFESKLKVDFQVNQRQGHRIGSIKINAKSSSAIFSLL